MKLSILHFTAVIATAAEAATKPSIRALGADEYDAAHAAVAAELIANTSNLASAPKHGTEDGRYEDIEEEEEEEQEEHDNKLLMRVLGANEYEETHAAIASEFLADAANFQEASTPDDDDKCQQTRRVKKARGDDRKERLRVGGKRLKLYCEETFKWQEERKCHNYCLEVDGEVEEGSEIRLQYCDKNSYKQRFKLERGRILRPAANRNLCVKNYKLRECDTELEVFGRSKFEIHDRHGECFTQMHHPKPRELCEFRDCRKARNSNTNLWKFC